jgi:hypothetical protein
MRATTATAACRSHTTSPWASRARRSAEPDRIHAAYLDGALSSREEGARARAGGARRPEAVSESAIRRRSAREGSTRRSRSARSRR